MRKTTAIIFIIIFALLTLQACKKTVNPTVPPSPAATSTPMSSDTGAFWTDATMSAAFPARDAHTSLAFNNNMWVIAGYSNTGGGLMDDVWSSSDGANWIQVTGTAGFGPRYNHSSAVYGGKMWVIGGY